MIVSSAKVMVSDIKLTGSAIPTCIPPTSVFVFSSLVHIRFSPPMHRLSQSSGKVARRAVGGPSAVRVARRYAHKDVKFSNEGRASILAGVDVLANAVSVTLGPKGVFFLLS